ncbi:MAG: tetratricopeptide repeat protein, partial [Sedimentisphaerales bacterium]
MFDKHTVVIVCVLLAITSTYAASPEQPNSMPQDPNYLRSIIDGANKGYPSAQFKLGEMYSKGNGVQQDCNEAFKWFVKAAEQGYTEEQFKVGEMYC